MMKVKNEDINNNKAYNKALIIYINNSIYQ